MASITREKDGRRTVQFVGTDGKRRSIRLGKATQKLAESVKLRVELLNAAAIAGHAPDPETSRWLAQLDEVMLDKLAAVHLVPKREQQKHATLGPFLADFMAGRSDVKGATSTVYQQAVRNLLDFFGPTKRLRDITPGDADRFKIWLVDHEELAEGTTARRRVGMAKQFFRAAVRRRLIDQNPFADVASVVRANASRFYFVTRDEAKRVLDACPDGQWRLLFALSRYGGLRCPSEHLGLRWGDIDWDRGRMTVRSPKTEHHEGRESRQVPIFPELRPYLDEAFELAEPGSEFVITRYRDTNSNLRTQLHRIISRAGLKPWPKLFQNLRSTRETELAKAFPIHVVVKWLGNSEAVAAKHYLQLTDSHFEQATQQQTGAPAVQNPVQQTAVSARTTSQGETEVAFCGGFPDVAIQCDAKVGPV